MSDGGTSRLRDSAGRTRRAAQALWLRLGSRLDATPTERFVRDGHNDLITRGLSLNAESIVLDFGGYLGDWTAEIRKRYGATVHVFEPIPEFATAVRSRFRSDPGVIVHQVALGSRPGATTLRMSADATGIGVPGAPVVVDVVGPEYLEAQGIEECDLATMNIEGGEYELIPALAESQLLPRFRRLLVQFHKTTPRSRIEREECHVLLASTHECDWDYPFVWESWSRIG